MSNIADQAEKAKALQAALAQIEKQFGKGTIMRLGEGDAVENIQTVSTGSTFGHWRQKIRLQYAATKLKEGENVTEVAFNCDYKSVSSFILAFKKRYGHTPGRAKDDALIQKRS